MLKLTPNLCINKCWNPDQVAVIWSIGISNTTAIFSDAIHRVFIIPPICLRVSSGLGTSYQHIRSHHFIQMSADRRLAYPWIVSFLYFTPKLTKGLRLGDKAVISHRMKGQIPFSPVISLYPDRLLHNVVYYDTVIACACIYFHISLPLLTTYRLSLSLRPCGPIL